VVSSLFGIRKIEKKATSDLFSNWDESKDALLSGLNSDRKDVMNLVLSNQAKYLSETATIDPAQFRKIMIPMIRRVIPGMIASSIIGVQPMTSFPIDRTVRLVITKVDTRWNVRVCVSDQTRIDEIKDWLKNIPSEHFWAYHRHHGADYYINFYDEETLVAFKLAWDNAQ